jgi:hypothetical protein
MVVHICNSSTLEAETRRSKIQGTSWSTQHVSINNTNKKVNHVIFQELNSLKYISYCPMQP